MFNNIKGTICKYCEMSWESLTKLKAFMKMSASFNSFDVENFNSPSLRIAQATNEDGSPVVFCPIETVFLISAYAVAPNVTPLEAQRAGDELDGLIARQAQRNGISKLLIVVPKDYPTLQDEEFQELRVYTRKIQHPVNLQGLGSSITSQATQFLLTN